MDEAANQTLAFPYEAFTNTCQINDRHIHLGCYETEEQAAMSYDRCCIYQVGISVSYGLLDRCTHTQHLAELVVHIPVLALLHSQVTTSCSLLDHALACCAGTQPGKLS